MSDTDNPVLPPLRVTRRECAAQNPLPEGEGGARAFIEKYLIPTPANLPHPVPAPSP